MAGVDPNILKASFSRARDLMNDPNFDKLVTQKKNNNNGKLSYNENVITDKNSSISEFKMPTVNNCKLPKEIIEDMMDNPINVDASYSNNIIESFVSPITQKKPQVTLENNNFTNNHSVSNVDYTIIKAIIDECLTRKLSELKSNLLNESTEKNTIQTMRMCKNNKIQILDTKGNLYEGVLTFKKNINNKA